MADTIAAVLALLMLIAFIAVILGLIKPSIIRQTSRGKAFGKSMVVFFLLFIAFIITVPKNESTTEATVREKTVSRKNIEAVIASLKKHYNIDSGNSDYEKGLNMNEVCWNNRACQVFAKTVQIQATHRSVEALTSSQVSPQYYQEVCSAIMIALTGANKLLIEQQIPKFFNYASQNGRSKWEVLGIEVTVSPDTRGLLGCDFYKPK